MMFVIEHKTSKGWEIAWEDYECSFEQACAQLKMVLEDSKNKNRISDNSSVSEVRLTVEADTLIWPSQ